MNIMYSHEKASWLCYRENIKYITESYWLILHSGLKPFRLPGIIIFVHLSSNHISPQMSYLLLFSNA